MDALDMALWLVAAAVSGGLLALAAWQFWNHWRLDMRIAACDPGLLSSELYKVETSTDAPAGSVILPYVPVRMVSTRAVHGGVENEPASGGVEGEPMSGSVPTSAGRDRGAGEKNGDYRQSQ